MEPAQAGTAAYRILREGFSSAVMWEHLQLKQEPLVMSHLYSYKCFGFLPSASYGVKSGRPAASF